MARERALVLGGGWYGQLAWEIGVLTGLADQGVDVTTADFMVGTSAAATVAAQVGSGLSLSHLFERQADPALQTHELVPSGTSVAELIDTMLALKAEIQDPAELRRQVEALALSADTGPETPGWPSSQHGCRCMPGPTARCLWSRWMPTRGNPASSPGTAGSG